MFAVFGLLVCGTMVLASRSSGPIMTTVFVLIGLYAWKLREHMRVIRWGTLAAIIGLEIVMKAPVYYLLARIDLTGSSTGWHRAELINAAITHLDEWWIAGTDYTRHWIAYGVPWSADHIDITNHYIKMGVVGGLPLMFLFVAVLSVAFSFVGKAVREYEGAQFEKQFMIWTLGAILFGHTVTFLSVSYFDQSIVFFLLVLSAIGSLPARCNVPEPAWAEIVPQPYEEKWAESLS
jgi:hypothetical protein